MENGNQRSQEKFGKFFLLEKLAAGGMAEVYLAKSAGATGINKFVAIKRILPQYSDNPDFIEMFKEEAKIAVNLNHSNIVSIYEFGIQKKQFFLVMEFVEGQNLRQSLNHIKKENREFSLEQIIHVIKEAAAGLDHAHRCLDGNTGRPLNITHRDISPQNIMISFEGEVKILDFGIAKSETDAENTRAGTIKGKFGYMSPEQAEGNPVDPRTDIFSLGIVLWELLAGDRLFAAANEAATLKKVRDCQIPSLRRINPIIPADLERICVKALARDKNMRYQTAAAFHKDLNRFLNTQFPEFSPQEFSKFMKTVYHRMYLENRKKLAEYARITVTEENTLVTSTFTDTESAPTPTPEASKVDLISLKTETKNISGRPFGMNPTANSHRAPNTMSGGQAGRRPVQTQSQIQIKHHSGASNFALWIAILTPVLIFGFWWMKKNQFSQQQGVAAVSAPQKLPNLNSPDRETANDPDSLRTAAPVKTTYVPLSIQSEPAGAVVYIDDDRVGLTPFRGHVAAEKLFKVSVTLDGYLPYSKPLEKATSAGYVLKATLQPEPAMGYLSLEVVNASKDTVVSINGQQLKEKLPLARYQVPANVPILIRATSPFGNLAAEQTVVVGQSQKKSVRLILARKSAQNQ